MNIEVLKSEISKVKVSRFDYSGAKEKWILEFYKDRFVISDKTRILLENLRCSNDLEEEVKKLNDVEKLVLEKIFNKRQKKKSNGLWFKFKILSEKQLKYFKFLSIIHNKKTYIGSLFICILLNMAILTMNFKMSFRSAMVLNYENIESIILLIGLGFIGVLFHELGHVSASLKHKISPNEMGLGMYFIYPVAYVDVTESWKLSKEARISIDFGGVYFQFLYATIILVLWQINKNNIFLYIYIFFMLALVTNLNPFLKYDGYWLLSDIFGIYNLSSKIPSFTNGVARLIFGDKSKYLKLRETWSIKVIITLFLYSVASMIFYIYFIFIISRMIYFNIIGLINNFNYFEFLILIAFIFFAIKSLAMLVKMLRVMIS